MTRGSCHCGKVKFEVDGPLGDVRYCYCTTCRKLSGAAFSAVAKVHVTRFRVYAGRQSLTTYASMPGKSRYYCSACFAPVYVTVKSEPELVRIRLGLLDSEPQVNVTAHMWVSEKPNWYKINDDLPQYGNEYIG